MYVRGEQPQKGQPWEALNDPIWRSRSTAHAAAEGTALSCQSLRTRISLSLATDRHRYEQVECHPHTELGE